MRFSASIVLGSVLGAAQARINGFQVPATIQPGVGFNLIVESSNYIQAIYDVAWACGYTAVSSYGGDLGTPFASGYLGPEQSNQLQNYPKWVGGLPSSAQEGPISIVCCFFSLIGAAAGPSTSTYNATVTIGSTTSTTYVSSDT